MYDAGCAAGWSAHSDPESHLLTRASHSPCAACTQTGAMGCCLMDCSPCYSTLLLPPPPKIADQQLPLAHMLPSAPAQAAPATHAHQQLLLPPASCCPIRRHSGSSSSCSLMSPHQAPQWLQLLLLPLRDETSGTLPTQGCHAPCATQLVSGGRNPYKLLQPHLLQSIPAQAAARSRSLPRPAAGGRPQEQLHPAEPAGCAHC